MCKEQPNFAGMDFPTLIYHLHDCFITEKMSTDETNEYFRDNLRLDFLVIVDTENEGQFSVLHVDQYRTLIASISYYKSTLPMLKRELCVLNPAGVLNVEAEKT